MSLFTIYSRIPFAINTVAGPIISYVSILTNICIFLILFDKSVKSPASVLMQGLAVADACTALCTYGFEPIFALQYNDIGQANSTDSAEAYLINSTQLLKQTYSIKETKELVDLEYPYCVMHYCVTQSADNFHLVSLLLTSSLGLQKLLAIICPIWSHIKITTQKTAIVCCVCFALSMVINIPKMFVVGIFPQENNSKCLFSSPHKAIENYVLTVHPVLFTIILIFATAAMMISTCYIIFILLRRKFIRGHKSSSKREKRSCMLIVCLMVVFLILEVPRLYLNITLFDTFKGDLDNDNIAWNKVKTEIEEQITKCYKADLQEYMSRTLSTVEMSNISTCTDTLDIKPVGSINKGPFHLIDLDMEKIRKSFNDYSYSLKRTIKPIFRLLIDDIIRKFTSLIELLFTKYLIELFKIMLCSKNITLDMYITFSMQANESPCHAFAFTMLTKNLPFLVLGSSPYSESLNYFLNIVWGHLDITLNQLKLIIEILKICTVLGCLSNFIIYIAMSGRLREVLLKKFNILNFSKKLSGNEIVKTIGNSSINPNKTELTHF